MSITEPGIYEMSETEYHADPCEPFSLSRGIARLLIDRSPMHAFHAHPRLGAGDGIEVSKIMDEGSAVHSMLLGKGARVVSVRAVYGPKHKLAGQPVKDFKTDAACEDRDAIREEGCIPILPHEQGDLVRAVSAVTTHLRWHQDGPDFFADGRSEAVVVWREGDLWLRCMIDRLPDDPMAPAYDLKVTKMSAAPGGWERRLRDVYAFQDAFYRRGLRAVRRKTPPTMRFVVVERDAPHGVSVMTPAPSLAALADAQVERAIGIWRECVKTGQWPGYAPFTAHIEAPPWMLSAEDDQALRDEILEEQEA